MVEFDLEYCANYPFTDEAKGYVNHLGLPLGEILKHPIYKECLRRGEMRFLDALRGRINPDLSDIVSQELTILTYPIARLIANFVGGNSKLKYASSEAKNAYDCFKGNSEHQERLMKDLKLVFDGDRISYVEYLKLTRTLVVKDSGWKLVNRIMHDGVVELKEGDKKELLAEKIRLRVLSPVDVKLAPAQVISTAEKIKKMLSAVSSEPSENDVSDEANPPCIKNMLFMLKSGNTTHAMMFILGTYFAGKELPEDKIVELFSAFPSFDEKKTRYQLKFLLGERGRTKYNCPSCSKIKSYGLCNGACGIKNPLQYKKRKTT